MTEIKVGDFWSALGRRPVGVTLVTCTGSEGPQGFLGLSAAHVSAAPPRMVVSVSKNTSALSVLLQAQAFAINVMPANVQDLAEAFGSKSATSAERFPAGMWSSLETGAPTHVHALSVFDCKVLKTLDLDDTVIVVGDVVALSVKETGPAPLVSWKGRFVPMA